MKRIIDIFLSILGLLVLLPVIIVLAVLVLWRLGTPIFFQQTRPGLDGKEFMIFKFRTMRDAIDNNGNSLQDIDRLTTFGQFLRSNSLDELPELWNVIKGDMSLVGPRPLLVEYMPLYNEQQARRHVVRPGITGWAQVNGRNAVSWEEKFELDIWYIDNWSIWLDIKILLLTVKKVLLRSDISPSNSKIMPRFDQLDER